MIKGTINQGLNLYAINSIGNCLFIVYSGKFVSKDSENKETNVHTPDHSPLIGEMALLHQCLREETVVAQADSTVFVLKRSIFKDIIEAYSLLSLDEKKGFLLNVELFSKYY